MGQLLELIGASVIGGMIMLIGLSLNFQINESSREIFQNTYTQRSAITAGQILEYDFYKAGYRTTGAKLIQADSSIIKFKADLDDNGAADTVMYYLSSTDSMVTTTNPNDRKLLRKINSQSAGPVSVVTRFLLSYKDSIGNNLSYASLTSPAIRAKVRSIRVYVKTELPDAINNTHNPDVQLYNPLDWQKTIRPKNLF
ncbi:MAG: hypothetical protein WC061_00870 [Melioribacteraceae bacterium]